MTPLVVGVDLSLTRTGMCVAGTCELITTKASGMDRLHQISQDVLDAVDGADLVLIEGYAMGTGRQSHTYEVGELGGVVRYQMWDRHISYIDIPPATLKKFATGKGNANKDTMVATAARAGCPADDNNAVDAWWLFELGAYALYPDICEYPITLTRTAYRDAAVNTIKWPEMEGSVAS